MFSKLARLVLSYEVLGNLFFYIIQSIYSEPSSELVSLNVYVYDFFGKLAIESEFMIDICLCTGILG